MPESRKRIVIVGGGFAGVTLAQRLEHGLTPETEIVVLSAKNHLVFTPMLPEVVGRSVSPLHIVAAGRQLTKRTRWLEGRVTGIDREKNEVHYLRADGSEATMPYTQLALACGSSTNLDEIPGLAGVGYPLKSVIEAIDMGNDIIANFEAAATESDAAVRRRLLTVVVIGGGFSGVEVAGHLLDLMRGAHCYYPELKDETPRVVLLQKGKSLLPELKREALSAFTLRTLQKNGAEVKLNSVASKVEATAVHLTSGERIEAGMIVCTVGTQTHLLVKSLGLPLEKGRLKCDPDMKTTGTGNLWALGDCAHLINADDGQPCSATAQFAIQQARQLAENLRRVSRGEATKPFKYRSRGMLATIGRRNAVGVIYGVTFSGFFAWFLWRGIYLAKLPTLGRKVEVAMNWACSIPFPPNIVQLGPSRKKRQDSGHQSEENKS